MLFHYRLNREAVGVGKSHDTIHDISDDNDASRNKLDTSPSTTNKISASVSQPHDKTFKSLFKEKYIARDIIRVNFPEDIVTELDFSTIKLVASSFVFPTLQEWFADLLYQIQFGDNHVHACFVFEHKSPPDKFTSLQVMKYMIALWESLVKENHDITAVVPIVFY